jgi:16S rRNA (adenine1518-N6/adenine1519-N6)-dimethyltransferase
VNNVSALPSLPEVISFYGLSTKKSLGQHFLLDTGLLAQVARSAGDVTGKQVIEIGPGPGGLTRALLATNAAHVTAIEKDARCIAALQSLHDAYPGRFHLLEEDGLKVDFTSIGEAPRVIVSNLPYNVGTAMILQWLELAAVRGPEVIESFTVMLQKEVAERLVAKPGSKAYGRISVLMELLTDSELLFDVPPEAFSPPPKVMSSIVRATFLQRPRADVVLKDLEKITATAFNQRRKMLRQSLKSLGGEALCLKAGIDPTLRPEQCDLQAFVALAHAL